MIFGDLEVYSLQCEWLENGKFVHHHALAWYGAADTFNWYWHVFLTRHVRSALGASHRTDDHILARLRGFPDGPSSVRMARRDRCALESGRFRPAVARLPWQQIRARVPPLNHPEF